MKTNSRQIIKELTGRFIGGAILSIDDIVADYIGSPRTDLAKRIYRKKAESWILGCKRAVKKQGEFLCVVENNGKNYFGIVTTKEQARVVFGNYYKLTNGILKNVTILYKNVKDKRMLPDGMRRSTVTLPRLVGGHV